MKNYAKGFITIHWLEAEKLTFINLGVTSKLVIWFTGSFGHDIENQRAQQYELTPKELDLNDTFIVHMNR